MRGKPVSPADQFFRMRDVLSGTTLILLVSNRVQEICQSSRSASISCYVKFGVLCVDGPSDLRSLSIPEFDLNGRKFRCGFPTCVSKVQIEV